MIKECRDGEIGRLLQEAITCGWDTAFYNYVKTQVERGYAVVEDERIVDWRYLLPIDAGSVVLVLGCGLGTVPVVLSQTCKKVYVTDPSWENIRFLNIRRKQQGINNLFPFYTRDLLNLPFPEGSFDLIVLRSSECGISVQLGRLIRHFRGLLKVGGRVSLSLANRLAFHRLFGKGRRESLTIHTIYGYKKLLRQEGFTDIQFYAPLPNHNGVPLFCVPVEDRNAVDYFLRNVFPLVETVPAEVKRAHALEYAVARAGVRLALRHGLTGLVKLFVPGFNIIARRCKI